jgi:hypothetical protein
MTDDADPPGPSPEPDARLARLTAMRPGGFPFGVPGERRCSFCQRREASVEHLVTARGTFICESCVALAQQSIAGARSEQRLIRLKPRLHGPEDRAVAEAAIEHAYEALFGAEATDDSRIPALEDGDALRETLSEVRVRFPQREQMDVTVDSIRFLDVDEAEVRFSLYFAANMPIGPTNETGHAVLIDGSWRVARETWCRLITRIGVQCPPAMP